MRNELSICICTVPGREDQLNALLAYLDVQTSMFPPGTVEIRVYTGDDPQYTKQNRFQREATGRYLCSIDDDDMVALTYIRDILELTPQNPDVITFDLAQTQDGLLRRHWSFRLGAKDRTVMPDGSWLMAPNQLTPVRADIAKDVPWFALPRASDQCHSQMVLLTGMLRYELRISRVMYNYRWDPAVTAQQTQDKHQRLQALKPLVKYVWRTPGGTYLTSEAKAGEACGQDLTVEGYISPEWAFLGETDLR